METVLSDEAYREKLFPILSKSADQVRSFALDNIRGSEYLDMTQEERDKPVSYTHLHWRELCGGVCEHTP